MVKVSDIIDVIEKIAPPEAAASWDVSGVQVASGREKISRIAVMLDPTLSGIASALHDGADFILSHHPLSMLPRFPNKADGYLEILTLLLGKKAWLYSAHTSLDANPEGPVRWAADDLGMTEVQLLEPAALQEKSGFSHAGKRYGFGFVGNLPKPLPYGKFVEKLRELTGKSVWRVCGDIPESVRRVAFCPGSGADFASFARAAKADVFVTGDVKYHSALDASGLLPRIIDVGHFCLEEEMMRRFAARLAAAYSVPVVFYSSDDPFAVE